MIFKSKTNGGDELSKGQQVKKKFSSSTRIGSQNFFTLLNLKLSLQNNQFSHENEREKHIFAQATFPKVYVITGLLGFHSLVS